MRLRFKIPTFSWWRVALAAGIIVAVGGSFFVWYGKNSGAVLTVSRGDFVERADVSGTVVAARNAALGFAANGRIAGVYARAGQHVEAGTILAETENSDLAATLAQKEAALAQKQADLASLRSGTRPEELAVASAAVANAEAALANAVQNAYTVSDDAVHNKADALFTNPRTNPKLVFTVANANLEMAVERARAAIEPVLASWALLVTTLDTGNASDSAQRSQTDIAQVTTLLADTNAALNQGVPDQTASSATLATARANVNAAATALTTSSSALDAARKTLALKQAGSTRESITAQEAAVSAASAEVENARALLAKTRVVAPFSGTVTRMDAKVGEIVSPTTSEIGMQSDGRFEIETYIPEVTIARIAVGNPATTTLDAYGSSVEFPSTVVAIDPAETIKDGVPTYKTTLAFAAADPRIRSGMTANIIIVTGTLHNAVVIPAGAVGKRDGAPYVSVEEGKQAVNRPVTTGVAPSLGQIEIVSGLSAGDRILLTPAAP